MEEKVSPKRLLSIHTSKALGKLLKWILLITLADLKLKNPYSRVDSIVVHDLKPRLNTWALLPDLGCKGKDTRPRPPSWPPSFPWTSTSIANRRHRRWRKRQRWRRWRRPPRPRSEPLSSDRRCRRASEPSDADVRQPETTASTKTHFFASMFRLNLTGKWSD